MARSLDGVSDSLSTANALLSASAGPWVIGGWLRPAALGASSSYLILSGSIFGNYWAVRVNFTADSLDFEAVGESGGNPNTGSAIAFDSVDVVNGFRWAYRYRGAAKPWERWRAAGDGGRATVTRNTISATFTTTLPTLSTSYTVIGDSIECDVGEIYVISADLTDDQMQKLLRGVPADAVVGRGSGLLAYWPIRGTRSPEPDYVGLPSMTGGKPLTITGTCAAAKHPRTEGPDVLPHGDTLMAWALDVYGTYDTIRAASTDLYDLVDADVLGSTYPKLITNGDRMRVSKSIRDGAAVATSPTTAILAREWRSALVRTYCDAVLRDDPVAFWRLGDPATDQSGGANNTLYDSAPSHLNAIVQGSPTLGAAGVLTGDGNDGMSNTGSSSAYGLVPAGVTAIQNLTAAMSVECWFKPAATSGNFGLVEHTAAASSNKHFLIFISGTTFYFRVVIGGTSYTASWNPGSLSTSTVYHVVGTYDGSNVRLYVNGTLRATTAASGALDTNSAWVTYLGRLGDSSYVVNGTLDEVALYAYALSATQISRHYSIGTTGPVEWRGARFRLRMYERASHECVTQQTGVVVDADFGQPDRVTLHLKDRNERLLDTLIPKTIVSVEEFGSASDQGAAIPVVFGRAYVNAPAAGVDSEDSSDPAGSDFILSHTKDADAANMSVRVLAVFYEQGPGPGLEKSDNWGTPEGTITYYDTDEFNVGSNLAAHWDVTSYGGTLVRFKTTASPSTYLYSYAIAYDTTNNRVRIKDAVLDAGLTGMQVSTEYFPEIGRYSASGAALLSIRSPIDALAGQVVATVYNPSIQNPISVWSEIMRNSTWGLAQSVNAGLLTIAIAAYAAAGLGDACNYALGGDRQQRVARGPIRELLEMRGAWMEYDGEDSEWDIYVDSAASRAWRTFGFADGHYNNIDSISYDRRTPLDDQSAVSEVNLRYGTRGRAKSNEDGVSFVAANDYEFSIYGTAMGVGTTQVEVNPWLTTYDHAKQVAAYRGKLLKWEDDTKGIVVGLQGRNVQLGELINLRMGPQGVDAPYRVRGLSRGLTETMLELAGYDDEIFTFSASDVSFEAGGAGTATSADTDTNLRNERPPRTGLNFVRGADYRYGLLRSTVPAAVEDAGVLPGFVIANDSPSVISALSLTTDSATVSGQYLTITVTSSGSHYIFIETNGSIANKRSYTTLPIVAGNYVVFSCYAESLPGGPTSILHGWVPYIVFYDETETSITAAAPTVRRTGETNRKGWPRYFIIARAPTDSAFAIAGIENLDQSNTALKTEAWKLELVGRDRPRPSDWTLGVDNALWLVAEESIAVPSSGSATKDSDATSKILPAGAVILNVDSVVTSALGGTLTGVDIGPKGGTANHYASALGKTVGANTTAVKTATGFVPGTGIVAANQVSLVPVGGNWGGGTIKVRVHYQLSPIPS